MDIKDLIRSEEALAAIDSGAWVDMSDLAPGLKLKVCGFKSEEARKFSRKMAVTNAKSVKAKAVGVYSFEDYDKSEKELMAEVILKDWSGLKDGKKDIPYDKDLARNWITSRAGEDLADLVKIAASRLDNDTEQYIESSVKNSQPA